MLEIFLYLTSDGKVGDLDHLASELIDH